MLSAGAPGGRAARLIQGLPLRLRATTEVGTRGVVGVAAYRRLNGAATEAKSLSLGGIRHYAERAASKPKAHTGRNAAPRAARAKAATADTGTSSEGSKKSTKAKKPKKKTAAKKKKVLTPEQKREVRIRELQKQLLHPPKQLPQTAFLVVIVEMSRRGSSLMGKEAAEKYRDLSPSQREHYNQIANDNKAKNAVEYKRWIQSLPVETVAQSNRARQALLRLKAKTPRSAPKLKDPRQPRAPVSAYALFNRDRWASGDFAGLRVHEAGKLISQEWAQLDKPKKEQYLQLYHQDIARYKQELDQTATA